MSENLYTAFGYVDEMEELDYGAEDVLPDMYDYHKRDIADEFEIVESTDRVAIDMADTGEDVADILEDCCAVGVVSADASADDTVEKFETTKSLYNDLNYIEGGDGFELPIDIDKREYNTESYEVFKDSPDMPEEIVEDIGGNDRIGINVGITNDVTVEVAELTVEEKAEQIATTIQKYYKSYDYLTMENKARLFDFRIDENSYNLKLHAEVLKKLGIHMYGSEDFEDYQGIYEETMKKAEKQGSDYECGYYDKKWERSRGR